MGQPITDSVWSLWLPYIVERSIARYAMSKMIKESKNDVHHCEDGIDVEWIRAAGAGKSSLLPIFDTSTSSGVLLS